MPSAANVVPQQGWWFVDVHDQDVHAAIVIEISECQDGVTFSWLDNLSWTHGKHLIKAGVDIRRIQMNEGSSPSGTLTYTTLADFIDRAQYGNPLADISVPASFGRNTTLANTSPTGSGTPRHPTGIAAGVLAWKAGNRAAAGCRDESRHGTHECVRHTVNYRINYGLEQRLAGDSGLPAVQSRSRPEAGQ
jgi:hypothetical protein